MPTRKCERLLLSSGVGSGACLPPGSHARMEYESHCFEAATCVEINQCVGCTRQFFTKSFLSDERAVKF